MVIASSTFLVCFFFFRFAFLVEQIFNEVKKNILDLHFYYSVNIINSFFI